MINAGRMFLCLASAIVLLGAAPGGAADGALTARNKDIVRNFYTAVFIGRNVDAAPRFLAPDYIEHSPEIATGLKGFMDTYRPRFARKPSADYKLEIVRVVGDKDIVVLFERSGGRPPGMNYLEVLWFDMYRVENGKIVEHWDAGPGATI